MLLDEPTTFFDFAHQLEVRHLCQRLNREEGKTMIPVLHDLNQAARSADHLIVMKGYDRCSRRTREGTHHTPGGSRVRAVLTDHTRPICAAYDHCHRKSGEIMMPLTLGLSLSPTWLRGQSWRRPGFRVEELFCADPCVEAAQRSEAACLNFVFKPDSPTLNTQSTAQEPGFSSFDSIVLMTAVA